MRFAGKARRAAGPSLARRALRPGAAGARRRLLRRAREGLERFEPQNLYQTILHGTTLAMVRYMEEHGCVPGAGDQFARWWPFVKSYAAALATDDFTGPGARARLDRLLDSNQVRPQHL